MTANDTQIGGKHYKKFKIQPWDFINANKLSFMQGSIISYLVRFREKGGIADLEKCKHYLDKMIEIERLRLANEIDWSESVRKLDEMSIIEDQRKLIEALQVAAKLSREAYEERKEAQAQNCMNNIYYHGSGIFSDTQKDNSL